MPTVGIFKRGYKKKPKYFKDIFTINELKKFMHKSFSDLDV